MKTLNTSILLIAFILSFDSISREGIGQQLVKKSKNNSRMSMFGSSCEPASASADLDINNVRTKLQNGGDMWWDFINPKYEIPKVNDPSAIHKNSLYAGALWIGGIGRDDGLLHMAAMTYRQRGSDFWPGPLDNNLSTDPLRCKTYDKIWKITRDELEKAEASNWTSVPSSIIDWPSGRNRPQFSFGEPDQMAPFKDINGNGVYEYSIGEHPVLNDEKSIPIFENGTSRQPDMFLWWVYNDKGNIHSETTGIPIGIEIQTTAFAYATNDEINNMTFYTSRIIKRGSSGALDNTYIGQFVDPDLGNYSDDYVGCDVGRSLGYCYNGDEDDEGVLGYGTNPPSVGIDFFEGPKDSIAGNSISKQLGLSAFMCYNNGLSSIDGDPQRANEYYNLLQGKFLNGSPVTYGKNGVGGTLPCRYMYPAKTDPSFPGQCWDEKSGGNLPGDRRFVQSSGPFTLWPGAVNKVTIGVVWARTSSGGAGNPCLGTGSLNLLQLASDKAQKLFNNKFKILDGPDAPDAEIQELEQEVVLKLLNTNTNKIEKYNETYKSETGDTLRYKFQGYMVYQLKDASISTGDLDNIEKARLLFQCDLKDGVAQISNKNYDPKVSAYVPVLKVEGADEGIEHSLSIKKDLFATSANQSLIDFQSYYYMVLSYAYLTNDKNNNEQFIAGRRNIKSYKAIPHKTEPELGGNVLGSFYGYGPKLQTIEGRGNGGNVLEFTDETITEILKNGKSKSPIYMGGAGPVKIKVIDPLKVPKTRFELVMREIPGTLGISKPDNYGVLDSIKDNSFWFLVNLNSNDTIFSDTTIAYKTETIQGKPSKHNQNKNITLADWGLSIEIQQVKNPGKASEKEINNGFISYKVEWENLGKQWLTGLADKDNGALFENWIRSGKKGALSRNNPNLMIDDYTLLDPNEAYEKIWNGRIAPYGLASRSGYDGITNSNTFGPASPINGIYDNPISELSSFQLVLTPDKSKWSECIVFETSDDQEKGSNDGQMARLNLRWGTSKDKDGNEIAGSKGKSWFPGYAINLETGERMNIAFGEDSHLISENGNDMLFNPTSNVFSDISGYPSLGGRHYIYIFGSIGYTGFPRINKCTPYDGCNDFATKLAVTAPGTIPSTGVKRAVLSQIAWVIPAYLAQGFKMDNGIPPTEMKISVNVQKAYNVFQPEGTTPRNNGRPMYQFSTEDIAPQVNLANGKKALDLANVVPNPYRAYSKYEISPIDSRVKITNLPVKCEIKIYTMSGILVRKIKKDDDRTFLDWDLKNDVNVPINSGLYIIHIDAGALGSKVIRWYGIMHTVDLDSY